MTIVKNNDDVDSNSNGGNGTADIGAGGGDGSETEVEHTEVENISGQFKTMKSVLAQQQHRNVDEKLEKILSDLSYMKVSLILLVIVFVIHVSPLRAYSYQLIFA